MSLPLPEADGSKAISESPFPSHSPPRNDFGRNSGLPMVRAIVFAADSRSWASDGTANATTMLTTISAGGGTLPILFTKQFAGPDIEAEKTIFGLQRSDAEGHSIRFWTLAYRGR